MGIENERKFVLYDVGDLFSILTNSHRYTRKEIDQYYFDKCRVRRTSLEEEVKYNFTYKKTLPSLEEIEIDPEITEHDFQALSSSYDRKLSKTRFTDTILDETWDIDFFMNNGEIYFIMAEVEMPTKRNNPSSFPKELGNMNCKLVSRADSRFTSRALCDVDYAKNLYEEFR